MKHDLDDVWATVHVMDSHFLAYVAGLFDGEGTVRISTAHRTYGGERKTYYQIETQVGMTDKAMIQMLQDTWPGHMSVRVRNGGANSKNYRDLWRWHLSRKRAAAFLLDVHPYLRLKREQADLALALDALMGKSWKRTDEEIAQMESMRQKMKTLNQRGVA